MRRENKWGQCHGPFSCLIVSEDDLGEGEIPKWVCTVLITPSWREAAKHHRAGRQVKRIEVNYKDERAIRVI